MIAAAPKQTNAYVIPRKDLEVTISRMVTCSTQIGTKNLDVKMADAVHKRTAQNTTIFNLAVTLEKLHLAARICVGVPNPKSVCAVGARPYCSRPVLKFAHYTNANASAGRWTPGTLTNQVTRKFMEPRVLVVADPVADHQAIAEAAKANIVVIAFCNADSDLRYIDVAIPCNNRGAHSIGLMFWLLAREIKYLRGDMPRSEQWDVMPDMFFYRENIETEKTAEADGEIEGDAENAEIEPAAHQDANQEWMANQQSRW